MVVGWGCRLAVGAGVGRGTGEGGRGARAAPGSESGKGTREKSTHPPNDDTAKHKRRRGRGVSGRKGTGGRRG